MAGQLFLLLVDDEPAVLQTTELILQRDGYSVSTAKTADDASRLLKAIDFDLVLLDCLPDYARLIQEAKGLNPNVRIAVCTGNPTASNLPLADIVLHKPIPPPILMAEIASLLFVSKAA
jgi:DNA-binding response OmpR family regulator